MSASMISRIALWTALLLSCLAVLSPVRAGQTLADRPAMDGVRSTSGADARHRVLFIATSNVPKGKFRNLETIAADAGIAIEARYLPQIPADADASIYAGFDAVFVDSYLRDQVKAHLAKSLPGLTVPSAWLYDKQPEWSGGMDEATARTLIDYYSNGGERNFRGFFALLAAKLDGRPAPHALPPPQIFPETAAYHPRLPGLVSGDPQAYLRWAGASAGKPVIAVLIHQQYIAAMQTGFIDDLIARIEARGATPLVLYAPAMQGGTLAPWLRPDRQQPARADVLINTQIMLDAEGRRGEFGDIGIPVIQAMPYRKGDTEAWRADPQGVALMDVPFYFAQSEYAGVFDIQVASSTRKNDDAIIAIPEQLEAVVAKAIHLATLRRKPNADKQLALMFWNYPSGEKNLSASFMNVPRSLQSTLDGLRAAGYAVPQAPPEALLIERLQRLLAPTYREGLLDALVDDGLAALLPLARYRAWLDALPAETRAALLRQWGGPEASDWVIERDGQRWFVIPRLQLGALAILPQPTRAARSQRDREKLLYHSMKADALPSHAYLASYLWVREGSDGRGHDALIHYGTHGTQEWMPGKERGLSVFDAPMLALGDIPVVYPYIVDNIGEAMQARRRGRAVTLSHQTPPFQPAGLYQQLTALHDLLHQWLAQDEGAVRQRLRDDLLAGAAKERILADMGWDAARARAQFPAFVDALHVHLHEIADTAQPLGLHSFGRAPQDLHRAATVLLMLGKPFAQAASRHAGAPEEDLDEAFTGDYGTLDQSAPYRLLQRHVIDGQDASALPEALRAQIEQARGYWQALGAGNEIPGLLAALSGQYTPTSYGGDPLKNPDAYPTGRNLYGFDPSRIPTPQAWAAGKQAAEALVAAHRGKTSRMPRKLAISLWSVETMRHQGMLEAQALWLLGVEPVWDRGGRVTDVRLVPRAQLGRPRVDVVLSATGLYRDHFPNAMAQLARAVQLAAQAGDEDDNSVAINSARIEAALRRRGLDADSARNAAQTRIFSSESGRYGTGLDDATLASDSWQGKAEGDRKLARLYLDRMQFAYGPDQSQWGAQIGAGEGGSGEALNLYAEQLRGTEGAVLSRTSNLYGMLTTDDPFQYLGGIALAVRHLDGKPPALYISNLRGGGSGRVDDAAQFLAKELATRQFHPGYIKGLMAEGYAGTLQVLDATNNFWGWTAVAREIVRDDQWQEMVDVYVRDKHRLGLAEWFERENPHALAQTIERMLEAQRQGYWQTDATTVAELKSRWRELSQRFDVRSDNPAFARAVTADAGKPSPAPAPGFGLQAPSPGDAADLAHPEAATPEAAAPPQAAQPAPAAPAPPAPATQQVRGVKLEKKASAALPASSLLTLGALLALALAGGVLQARRFGRSPRNGADALRLPAWPLRSAP